MPRRLLGSEIACALAAVLIARIAINGGHRIVYPFLPEIARGLDTTLATVGVLLAVRAAMSLGAPAIPIVAEVVGRRTVMLIGIGTTIVGFLVIAGAPGLLVAGLGFACLGLGKPAFDVPMQSWFGARVPYERRGRVLGITELTWALGLALAFPAGLLITVAGWRAPFALLAALGVVGAVAVIVLMSSDRPAHRVRRPLRLSRALVAILIVVLLFRFAAELLFVVYGTWLESDFGLSAAAIGAFTLLVVAAELTGEGYVAALADRVGLKRSILLGLLGTCVAYASLGWVDGSLPRAIAVVVAWFALFEVTIVATIPFVSELAGEARDRLLSLLATVAVGGGGLAALVAPQLYQRGGVAVCGLVAAGCVATAAIVLYTAVPTPASRNGQAVSR